MHALAHLGAAMIYLGRAILVEQDERAGLVEVGRRERNAKLHRRHGQTALAMRMLLVPLL